MGALVTRYYLRYGMADLPGNGSIPSPTWAGAKQVGRVVLVAPPNAGSIKALTSLIDGNRPAMILPHYPAAVVGTAPSLYQLLPRGRHGMVVDRDDAPIDDLFSPQLWETLQWGLADPGQAWMLELLLPEVDDPGERRRIAHNHQAKALVRAKRSRRPCTGLQTIPRG